MGLRNCNYILDDFRRRVPQALASILNHTILIYYLQCKYKMDFYQEGINYGSLSLKIYITYYKLTNKDEDR